MSDWMTKDEQPETALGYTKPPCGEHLKRFADGSFLVEKRSSDYRTKKYMVNEGIA